MTGDDTKRNWGVIIISVGFESLVIVVVVENIQGKMSDVEHGDITQPSTQQSSAICKKYNTYKVYISLINSWKSLFKVLRAYSICNSFLKLIFKLENLELEIDSLN